MNNATDGYIRIDLENVPVPDKDAYDYERSYYSAAAEVEAEIEQRVQQALNDLEGFTGGTVTAEIYEASSDQPGIPMPSITGCPDCGSQNLGGVSVMREGVGISLDGRGGVAAWKSDDVLETTVTTVECNSCGTAIVEDGEIVHKDLNDQLEMVQCDECGFTDIRKPQTDCPICQPGVMLGSSQTDPSDRADTN